MNIINLDQYRDEIIANMPPKQFTRDGRPKMKPLNRALKEAGYDSITQEQRNNLEIGLEPAPEPNLVAVTITKSRCNPVHVHVNGSGQYKLWINEETNVPQEAISALDNVEGLAFTIKGEDK